MADENRYLQNDDGMRKAFAEQLEELASMVRAGNFEHVSIAWKRKGRLDAVLILTGPDAVDYKQAIVGIQELLIRAKIAQQEGRH